MSTLPDPSGRGYDQKDGLSANGNVTMEGTSRFLDVTDRNFWQLGMINPDGTGLTMFSGTNTNSCGQLCMQDRNHSGMNFGRPGSVAKCVGCHIGHTMIPLPASDADAQWTNLAPGAVVSTSSGAGTLLVDRKAAKGSPWSASSATGQWAKLTFPVPIKTQAVRLWNPRNGIAVNSARVRLFLDSAATQQVGDNTSGVLSIHGTDVAFNDVVAQTVRVDITSVTGSTAALAEIEVIASGNTGATPPPTPDTTPPVISGVSGSQITANSAVISWLTNEIGDSQVEYGLSSSLGSFSAMNPTQTTAHQVGLSGLGPGKTYYFKVMSKDASGNLGTSNVATFATTAVADTTPPAPASSLSAVPGNGQVSLKWTNPSDSDLKGVMVRCRTDGTYPIDKTDGLLVADRTGVPSAADTFVHSGLSNGASYYYSVFAYDVSLNFSSASKTWATPSTVTISSLSPNRGPTGTIVTVLGLGFGNTQGTSKVTFSGTTAAVLAWSNTSITTTIPSGAISGPVVVTVNAMQSNSLTFKVNGKLPPPKNVSQK